MADVSCDRYFSVYAHRIRSVTCHEDGWLGIGGGPPDSSLSDHVFAVLAAAGVSPEVLLPNIVSLSWVSDLEKGSRQLIHFTSLPLQQVHLELHSDTLSAHRITEVIEAFRSAGILRKLVLCLRFDGDREPEVTDENLAAAVVRWIGAEQALEELGVTGIRLAIRTLKVVEGHPHLARLTLGGISFSSYVEVANVLGLLASTAPLLGELALSLNETGGGENQNSDTVPPTSSDFLHPIYALHLLTSLEIWDSRPISLRVSTLR